MMSSPFNFTKRLSGSPINSTFEFSAISTTSASLFGEIPFCKTANATARYIAPVSRYSRFSFFASILPSVDFPAPEGPSMAIIIFTFSWKKYLTGIDRIYRIKNILMRF